MLPPGLTGEERPSRSQRDTRRDEEDQSWTIAVGVSASDEELSNVLFETVRAADAEALYILPTNGSALNSALAASFTHLQAGISHYSLKTGYSKPTVIAPTLALNHF